MRPPFRPTPFGAAILASSFLLGALGALRGELATLLWGTAFIGMGIFCFLGCLSTIFLVRRSPAGTSEAALPFDGIDAFAGEPLGTFWPLPVPRRLPPGIFLFGELTYISNRRVLKGLGGVDLHRRGAEIRLPSPPRGAYKGSGRLVCRDALGLFQGTLPLGGAGSFRIFPPVLPGEPENQSPSPGAQGPASSGTMRRSRELFDLRKYNPGDDPRRVHWKLFAHTDELFLRQGEEVPPPTGEFFVYLDLSAPGVNLSPLVETFLDNYLGRLALWGGAIMKKGGTLLFSELPGQSANRFSPGEEVKFLRYLAELAWRAEGSPLEKAEHPRFFFLTTPLSKDWELRLAELKGQGWRGEAAVLVPRTMGFEAASIPPPFLETLVFRGRGKPLASKKEAALLAERGRTLLRELEEKHPPGGFLVL